MSDGTVDYIGSKRIGPTFEAFPSNPEKEFLFADQELLHLIWVFLANCRYRNKYQAGQDLTSPSAKIRQSRKVQ